MKSKLETLGTFVSEQLREQRNKVLTMMLLAIVAYIPLVGAYMQRVFSGLEADNARYRDWSIEQHKLKRDLLDQLTNDVPAQFNIAMRAALVRLEMTEMGIAKSVMATSGETRQDKSKRYDTYIEQWQKLPKIQALAAKINAIETFQRPENARMRSGLARLVEIEKVMHSSDLDPPDTLEARQELLATFDECPKCQDPPEKNVASLRELDWKLFNRQKPLDADSVASVKEIEQELLYTLWELSDTEVAACTNVMVKLISAEPVKPEGKWRVFETVLVLFVGLFALATAIGATATRATDSPGIPKTGA